MQVSFATWILSNTSLTLSDSASSRRKIGRVLNLKVKRKRKIPLPSQINLSEEECGWCLLRAHLIFDFTTQTVQKLQPFELAKKVVLQKRKKTALIT